MSIVNYYVRRWLILLSIIILSFTLSAASHNYSEKHIEEYPKKISFTKTTNNSFQTQTLHFPFNHRLKSFVIDIESISVPSVIAIKRPDINFITFHYSRFGKRDSLTYSLSGHNKYSQNDPHPHLNIDSTFDDKITVTFQSIHRSNLLICLYPRSQYVQDHYIRQLFYGIFIGSLLITILYNFFIFLSTKELSFILYVIYVISTLLTQTSILGVYQKYFPFFGLPFNNIAVHVFTTSVGISGTLFAHNFLNLSKHQPQIVIFIRLIVIGYCISGLLLILKQYILVYRLLEILGAMASVVLLFAGISAIKTGFKPGRYFVAAWSIFLIGIFVYVLKEYNIIPNNNFSNYLMPIGSAIEATLLSFALADRINTLKKEKEINQKRIYEEMRRSRDLLNTQKMSLEKMVADRTKSLAEINENLNNTLINLRETQAQLIDSEKMASLGQLTAGIAHEINNPINFVSSNVKPLKQDIQDILSILYKYHDFAKKHHFEELDQIQKEAELLNLEYSIQEIEHLIKGISEGAKRTSTIVNSLKTFSRADKDEASLANVNSGLESTLNILRSQLGPIKLNVQYGELPEIICFPGKLNQVFMNVIDNSIDSIQQKFDDLSKGIIDINTYFSDGNIFIEIQDNGEGIPLEIQSKIFEPFFTTKEVGRGTGLGLSISYGIIESHGGKISVNSSNGSGTIVNIRIPSIRSHE